jgi:hypothetical protein
VRENPEVVRYGSTTYAIRFRREDSAWLHWIQDLTARKLKSSLCGRPVVEFESEEAASNEVRSAVLAYLIHERGVEPDEIIGW